MNSLKSAQGGKSEEKNRLLRKMFEAAVDAAQPDSVLPEFIPDAPRGRTLVLGAGKASAAMARSFEQNWRGGDLTGLVVTGYGHAVECENIDIATASHPVPDEAGQQAAQRMLEMASDLSEDDLVAVSYTHLTLPTICSV